jgi:hypothetical protein
MFSQNISINNIKSDENWSDDYLKDNIFNNLLSGEKDDKYIKQFIDKFHYFRIKSPKAIFLIHKKDLNKETTIIHLETYVKDCKTPHEKRIRLDGIFTEVIA